MQRRRFYCGYDSHELFSTSFRLLTIGIALMAVALSALATPLIAQQTPATAEGIHIGASVHVSKDLPAEPHGETEIAANPQDATQLVACSMMFPNDSPSSEVATYVSLDGGSTWKLSLRTKGQDGYESWDPDCRFGPGHVLYSLSEGVGPDYPDSYNRVDRSNDGGRTWETPTRVLHAERSFIVADSRQGPQNGWLYMYGLGEDASSIRVGYSTDGGKTFLSQVVPMEKGLYDLNVGPGAVLSDGSLVFPMPVMKQSPEESQQGFRVRLPAQIQLVRLNFQEANWPLKVEASKVAPWFADFEPNGSYYTSLGVDQGSGPFRDRIYVVWEDRSSDRSQVKLSFSTDKGKTWSNPRLIDDDVARQVGDIIHGPDDIHGSVAVTEQGVVGVMWFDRREFLNNLGWAVRFRASLDGGETFLPSVKASEVDYDPGRGGRVYLFGGSGEMGAHSTNTLSIPWFVFHGGHTMGLAADANGRFHPLWIANPTGIPQLWTTDITVGGKVVKNGNADLAKLEDASTFVRLEFLNRYYDMQTHSVDFELRLRNASKATIRGPLKVRVLDAGSYVGDVTIQQGGKEANVEGAVWDFSGLPGGVFHPGDVTKPVHVHLLVRGIDPFTQSGRFSFFLTPLATLTTKVLAGSIELPKGENGKD